MMPAPPLLGSVVDLSAAVHAMADQHELDFAERRAALEVLGEIIGEGETSHVRCLRRVADLIEHERPRLLEIAARHAGHDTPTGSAGTGTQPAPQEELRWDLKD